MQDFFAKFKKNFDFIAGYSSIFGLPISLIGLTLAFYQGWQPIYIVTLSIFTFLILILVALNIYMTRKYYDIIKENYIISDKLNNLNNELQSLKNTCDYHIKNQSDIAQIFHNIFHEYRKIVYKLNYAIFDNNFEEYSLINKSFESYCLFMLINIKEIFDLITFDKCSVCLKFIVPNLENPQEILVKTWMRDSISYRERSEIDRKIPSYPCNENTAFKRIISNDYDDSYFLSNNLFNEKGYINLNSNWQKYYNACLVVPIRIALSKNEYSIIGFICVDNMKGNFDKAGFNFLASFADSCFNLFDTFNNFKNMAMELKKGGIHDGT